MLTGLDIIRLGRALFLRGELDLSTHYLLAQAGEDLLERCTAEADRAHPSDAPATDVVIDTAGLRFIDAGGLGVLITLRAALGAIGVPLRTIHPSRQLRRVSGICQLDTTLGLNPNEQHLPARAWSGRLRTHSAPIPHQTTHHHTGPQPAGRTA